MRAMRNRPRECRYRRIARIGIINTWKSAIKLCKLPHRGRTVSTFGHNIATFQLRSKGRHLQHPMNDQFASRDGRSPFRAETPIESQNLAVFAEHCSKVMAATDHETVWNLTCKFFRDLGFAHAVYGYSPDSWGVKLGAPEDYLVLTTFPSDVAAEMVREGLYLQSVTFHWALKNVGVASWSMTPEECGIGPEFIVNPDALEFFYQHGLLYGCSVGFPNERTRGNAAL